MSITRALAERAQRPLHPDSTSYLRALTLTNAAAAVGDLGRAGKVCAVLPIDDSTPAGAAFAHAVRLHARTQDDFHPAGRVHVGAVTLAATLALADRADSRLLECVGVGYEAMCTVACVYSPDAQRRGYRPTGMFGPIGAAASAAAALELDPETFANALGLAVARSGGTNQSWLAGTDEWLLELGYAARSGVEAALMAEAGVKAAPDAFEGAAGWARAYFDDEGADRLVAEMRTPHSYVQEVAQKPYPVSGIAQVATQLACEASQTTFPEEVEVRMSEGESQYPGSANRGPFHSRSDALMSVAFCVACGLTDGRVRLARLDAPLELQELAERVHVVPDVSLPEGTATLVTQTNGDRHEETRASKEILFARWDDASLESSTLASRSEASVELITALRESLGAERPEAAGLHSLLRGQA